MGSSSIGSTRSVSFISRWICAIEHARISTSLNCELNPHQIRLASKRTFRRMCTTTLLMPPKTANTTTAPRNLRRSTNPSPHPNHSPFNRLPLEFKMRRLPYSKTASSQRIPRKSTSRLRRASKPTKPSPFLELTLARLRAQAIHHRNLISALPSRDRHTQRRGEWRVHRLARDFHELPCIRYAMEKKLGQEKEGGLSKSHSLISIFLFSPAYIPSWCLGCIVCLG